MHRCLILPAVETFTAIAYLVFWAIGDA